MLPKWRAQARPQCSITCARILSSASACNPANNAAIQSPRSSRSLTDPTLPVGASARHLSCFGLGNSTSGHRPLARLPLAMRFDLQPRLRPLPCLTGLCVAPPSQRRSPWHRTEARRLQQGLPAHRADQKTIGPTEASPTCLPNGRGKTYQSSHHTFPVLSDSAFPVAIRRNYSYRCKGRQLPLTQGLACRLRGAEGQEWGSGKGPPDVMAPRRRRDGVDGLRETSCR